MADYRRMRPGFGGYADQLSISGPIGGEELGWEASPSGGTGTPSASVDYTGLAGTFIETTGGVLTSIFGQQQPDMATPVNPGYTPPRGTAVGMLSGVNINLLIIAGLGALAILMISKKSG